MKRYAPRRCLALKLHPYIAMVVKDLEEDIVIGTSLMRELEVELDLKAGKAKLRGIHQIHAHLTYDADF